MLKIDKSWQRITEPDFSKKSLDAIMVEVNSMINEGKIIYPEYENIFAAFNKTPLDKVRVVILGQDPYHQPMEANGLAFSVNARVNIPPSLRNIFKELESDLSIVRTNTDLSDWAEQGILLLNTALTVEQGCPNSHKLLWQSFTDDVINFINELKKPVMFVLWGKNAQSKKKYIANPIHTVIESAHPSPLGAYRGFWNSKPFSRINEALIQNNQLPIKWG